MEARSSKNSTENIRSISQKTICLFVSIRSELKLDACEYSEFSYSSVGNFQILSIDGAVLASWFLFESSEILPHYAV